MDIGKTISHLFLKYMIGNNKPKVIEGKRHIACIGDSITYGAGVNGREKETWEHYLNGILGTDVQVINYGASGRTLQDEGDYPYTADKIYRYSLDCRTDIYVIMLGTNDAKPYNWNAERYEREYASFLGTYAALDSGPELVLMTPPSCFPEEKTGIVAFDIDPENVRKAAEIVRDIADRLDLKMIDLYEKTKDHPDWFVDGVHPNAKGNREIAEIIAEFL